MGSMENFALNFDPRFEDPQVLRPLSRRGFLGHLLGGATVLAFGANAFAASPTTQPGRETGAVPDDERYWELVASEFLLRKNISYMNTGTRGPSPRCVHMAQIDALNGVNADYFGFTKTGCNKDFLDTLRGKLAAFVGAKPAEIAFTSNTTEGMIFGTLGVELKPGDEIAFTNHDHSSGGNPIMLRAARGGLSVRVIDLADRKFHPPKDPDEILKAFDAALTPKTKLLSFCHINYTDGCVMPVKEICAMARAKGVITLVDGAQPPGMMKLNLHELGCDMYAGPCHKWILASMFTGFFYVREEMLDRVWPTMYTGAVNGKTMYGKPPSETMAEACKGAAKFEYHGSADYPPRFAVNAALDFHTQITPEAIEARDRYLAQRFMMGLHAIDGVQLYTSGDPRLSCALVAFTVQGVPTKTLMDTLWDRHGIYIRNVTHEEIGWDVNRASLHIMVTTKQVDALLGAITELARKKV
ncbi:MAG: aminotransferase class V-fold PLP-dependent enzyme [Candidatus Binatia bacterium]